MDPVGQRAYTLLYLYIETQIKHIRIDVTGQTSRFYGHIFYKKRVSEMERLRVQILGTKVSASEDIAGYG